jgi:hypothetical protein
MKLDVHGANQLLQHQHLQSVPRELQQPIPKNQITDSDNSPSFGNHVAQMDQKASIEPSEDRLSQ